MVAADSLAVAGCTLGAGYGAGASGSAISAFMSLPIAIFGLIMSVIIIGAIPAGQTGYCAKVGYAHFNAGLATGGCGLAGGLTIVGMAQLLRMHKIKCFPEQVPAEYQAPVFSGLLGCGFALFGLIVGLVMSGANCSA